MVLLWGVVSGSTETLTPGCGVGVVPETVPQSLQPPLPPDAGVGVSAGCAGAAVWYGEPFPDHAVVLTRILVGVAAVMLFCSVVYGVRAATAYRRDRRRLGMIRMDTSGRFYYDKRK